jgi:hypothetical protein
LDFDNAYLKLNPVTRGTLDQIPVALSDQNLDLVKLLVLELEADLQHLLNAGQLTQLTWVAGRLESHFTTYLTHNQVNREIGLWMLPKLDLGHGETLIIQDDILASLFAQKNLSEDHSMAHSYLIGFCRQYRPQCCEGLVNSEQLVTLFNDLDGSDQVTLIREMIGALCVAYKRGHSSPTGWDNFLRDVEAVSFDRSMPTWEGADLAIFLKDKGLNKWLESSLPSIARSPRLNDLDHFNKLDSVGFKLRGLERKSFFTTALMQLSLDDQDIVKDAKIMIEAIMVYDFFKNGDYAYTSCTSDRSVLDPLKARAASHIWTMADQPQRASLVEMLDLEFTNHDRTSKLRSLFGDEVYMSLAVGPVSALEQDLGL